MSIQIQKWSEKSGTCVIEQNGKEFELEFENPVLEVIPTAHGKTVNIHNENR